jgi:hypothetical protein
MSKSKTLKTIPTFRTDAEGRTICRHRGSDRIRPVGLQTHAMRVREKRCSTQHARAGILAGSGEDEGQTTRYPIHALHSDAHGTGRRAVVSRDRRANARFLRRSVSISKLSAKTQSSGTVSIVKLCRLSDEQGNRCRKAHPRTTLPSNGYEGSLYPGVDGCPGETSRSISASSSGPSRHVRALA